MSERIGDGRGFEAERHIHLLYIEGILPKGPYPTCLRMADRALLAGYPRHMKYIFISFTRLWTGTGKWFRIERTRAPFQYPISRLTVRSHKVSKPRDLYLELSDRSEIWQAPRQQGCRSACQISKRYDNLIWSTPGDLPISRLRDFTRSYNKTPYRILKRGPGRLRNPLSTRQWTTSNQTELSRKKMKWSSRPALV